MSDKGGSYSHSRQKLNKLRVGVSVPINTLNEQCLSEDGVERMKRDWLDSRNRSGKVNCARRRRVPIDVDEVKDQFSGLQKEEMKS